VASSAIGPTPGSAAMFLATLAARRFNAECYGGFSGSRNQLQSCKDSRPMANQRLQPCWQGNLSACKETQRTTPRTTAHRAGKPPKSSRGAAFEPKLSGKALAESTASTEIQKEAKSVAHDWAGRRQSRNKFSSRKNVPSAPAARGWNRPDSTPNWGRRGASQGSQRWFLPRRKTRDFAPRRIKVHRKMTTRTG